MSAQWNVQVRYLIQCEYCYHSHTVSTDCASPAEAIAEVREYGYTLEAKGPKCDTCHEEDAPRARGRKP